MKGRQVMAAEWPTHKVYESDVNSIKELLYSVLNNINENHRDLRDRAEKLSGKIEDLAQQRRRVTITEIPRRKEGK